MSPSLLVRRCPLLGRRSDWCDQEVAWPLPPHARALAKEAGLAAERLQLSHLLLARSDDRAAGAADTRLVAGVMGHEVAHALAVHGAQRMSAGMLQQLGAVAGNVAIQDPEKRNVFNQAYGVGSQVGVMLPFSRSHETEADRIGLQIMAIAGYNPDEAANLWRRMKANAGGQAPPEFLSTHPSSDTRISNLTAWAPAAKQEAAKFGVTSFK